MSEDWIRRSDAIKAIAETIADDGDTSAWLYVAEDMLKGVPSADRPSGEWIDRSDGGRILHPWWESYECSQCKEQGSGAWNFCPHCGARMKGADDETD